MKWKLRIESILILILIFNGILFTWEATSPIKTNYRFIFLVVSLILSARAIYYKDTITQIKTIIGLSFLGNELFYLILPALFFPRMLTELFTRRSITYIKKLQVGIIALLFYSLLLILWSYSYSFSFFNLLLWILTFASFFLVFIYYLGFSYREYQAVDLFRFFKRIILLQVAILLMQAVIHRDFHPGDSWSGSFGNSLPTGFYLFLGLLFHFSGYFIGKKRGGLGFLSIFRFKNVIILFGAGVLLFFNDSKILLLCFAVAVVIYFLFYQTVNYLATSRKTFLYKIALILIFLFLGLWTIYDASVFYLNKKYGGTTWISEDYMNPTLDRLGGNGKFVLYRRTYVVLLQDHPVSWMFGIGPGKFGSKSANIMAYDILYKLEDQTKMPQFIKPYSADLTKELMGDLWTKEIVELNKYRSATLAMPYAGLITVKGEYGFFGLLFFMMLTYFFSYYLIVNRSKLNAPDLKRWTIVLSIFWFSLPIHMIFDNFQEKGDIILPMILLSAVISSIAVKTSPLKS